jgi:2-(1,2-epoxy-1,2-dihydrophenyl)acetyl-CoA isomerase
MQPCSFPADERWAVPYKSIVYDIRQHVATIVLNRPETFNALSDPMVEDLKDAMDRIASDRDVRVVVMTGAGKAFCAGGDVNTMMERLNSKVSIRERREYMNHRVAATAKKIRSLRQPVLAAINGAAIGAGAGLALLCDIRIASEKARLGFPYVKRGLALDWGVAETLPRLVGTAHAIELVSTGRVIDAKTALEIGLINRIVPHETFMSAVDALCVEIANNAPLAVAMCKSQIMKEADQSIVSALEFETYSQTLCQSTEDHREGVQAFLEKRDPEFKGK